ncbi:hypothetical protein TMatcc_001579 [Talaromyces marneffei ATCC 18224]
MPVPGLLLFENDHDRGYRIRTVSCVGAPAVFATVSIRSPISPSVLTFARISFGRQPGPA